MSMGEQTLDSILVAVDGSRSSQTAAILAIQIAQREKLLIHGLFVVDELLVVDPDSEWENGLSYQTGKSDMSNERANKLRGQGDTALRWLEDRCQTNGVLVQADLMFGGLPDLIIDKAHSAHLVALGRRGYSHNEDKTYLGRHLRAIVHHLSMPLLIGGDELVPIRRILLAYNGSQSAKQALTWASLLQRIWHTHLLVLAVVQEEMSLHWAEEIDEQISAYGLENYRFVTYQGDPATQIATAVAKENIDLIVMGGPQHNPLLEWAIGSTLDNVLRSTASPIFVISKN